MLKVSIDLVPFGQDEFTENLHTIYIGNVGGDREKASYHAWLNQDPRYKRPRPDPHVIVTDYERCRGAVELTEAVIEQLRFSGQLLATRWKPRSEG